MRTFSLLVEEGVLFKSISLCIHIVTPAAVIHLLEVPLFSQIMMLVLVVGSVRQQCLQLVGQKNPLY